MAKIISVSEAAALVKDGMTVMISGFLGCGAADRLIHALSLTGAKELTVISNDGGQTEGRTPGVEELIRNGQVKHLITTHIGRNKEAGAKRNEGTLKVTLVPQGSLAEKIRAGGCGLGGVLTPVGLGTAVGVGSEDAAGGVKESVVIDGKEFLLERPLRADVAFLYGTVADRYGNVKIHGTARNMNPLMAAAADIVICQADELVEQIDPDEVLIPGVLVNYVTGGDGEWKRN